jgi:hypothetical protein
MAIGAYVKDTSRQSLRGEALVIEIEALGSDEIQRRGVYYRDAKLVVIR